MKNIVKVLAIAAACITLGTAAMASEKDKNELGYDRQLAEENLLIGIASDNQGLRESAAFLLGEIGSRKAVVPLMQMLHDGHESTRIVAALALSRIGEARGTYAVKRAAKFDESPRVQQLCAWYYTQYVEPGSFEFVAPGSPEVIQYANSTLGR